MLIKITNYCSMGCSHCMEDSTVKGEHMTRETFGQALEATLRIEAQWLAMGMPLTLMLSGGECTEHPDVVDFVQAALGTGALVVLLSNGMFLANDELRESLLRPEWKRVLFQVTHDPRFYPTAPPEWKDPRITYIPALTGLITLGRAARSKKALHQGVPVKGAPSSFNLRSVTRSLGSIEAAVAQIRLHAVRGKNGWCTPAISADGDITAGETNACFVIGNVHSSTRELTRALINMQCNRCGLVTNLTQQQKRAIGESVLYGENES